MGMSSSLPNFLQLNYARITSYRVLSLRKLFRVWEQQHLKQLLPYLNADCVFDVGANYGQYAQMLRRHAGFRGRIISFEPIPDAAAHLRKISAGDPLWTIEECALSDSDGEQGFNIMCGSKFSSLRQPSNDETSLFREMNRVSQSVTVKTETLATAFNRLRREFGFQRPFLKMDTQGYDVDIVRSGQSVIREFLGLQSELAVRKLYKNSADFHEAITCYEQSGFSLSAFVPNNAGHFPELIETDCIMIRSDLIGHAG